MVERRLRSTLPQCSQVRGLGMVIVSHRSDDHAGVFGARWPGAAPALGTRTQAAFFTGARGAAGA